MSHNCSNCETDLAVSSHLKCSKLVESRGVSQLTTARHLEADLASGDVILTILARKQQPALPPSITTPEALRLRCEPIADCGRYDSLRRAA
jgi:hypothetical protein